MVVESINSTGTCLKRHAIADYTVQVKIISCRMNISVSFNNMTFRIAKGICKDHGQVKE